MREMIWQPIATAPKDGTKVWCWLYDEGIHLMQWMSPDANMLQAGGSDPGDYVGCWVMPFVEIVKGYEVRDDLVDGTSACLHCKGQGKLYAWVGWTDFMIGRPYYCDSCDGRGLLREARTR